MRTADSYRRLAAELRARAVNETNASLASEWDNLARCYLRLAAQADTNSVQDLWLEFGPAPRLRGDREKP